MIDVTEQISAVRRHIGSRVLAAGEARVMTVSQTYDTDLDDLWDACTNPERIPRWFMPISGSLQVGGQYQLEGNANGTIQHCDPPNGFAATWEYNGEVSWIEVRLSAGPAGATRFELEHVAHVSDELWAQFGPGATGIGWDMALFGLAGYVGSGQGVTPEESLAWAMSEDGVRFMTLSSEAWRAADVTAGTPEDAARASADRVLAFYTAPPEA
ncbi:MAG: SRPBCC family protein [Kibdelosporangium sp.]